MSRLGPLLVLLAVVSVQIPWLSCHSDCRSSCTPLVALVDHHCHDELAHGHSHCVGHGHNCTCGTESVSEHVDDPIEDDVDPDHDPGDHELAFHDLLPPTSGAEAPNPPTPVTTAILPPACELTFGAAAACGNVRSHVPEATGPPPDLATIRLLL